MAEETHVAVTHEGEGEHEPHEEAAAAAVATAGAAVALAHETAAHAELQAAEEIAEVGEEIDEWKATTSRDVQLLSENLRQLREEELQRHETERLALVESYRLLAERMEAVEAHPSLKSILPASEAEAETSGETEEAEENPLVGGEVAANVGPVEAASSASLQNPLPETTSPSRRKRRWI